MKVNGEHIQSIWYELETDEVCIIDQARLPYDFEILSLQSLTDACRAISSMEVRGAPLIGVTAAYGVYLALREDSSSLDWAIKSLSETRPTAVNLRWSLQRMKESLEGIEPSALAGKSLETAQLLEKEDIAVCEAIGDNGLGILQALWTQKSESQKHLNVLTHCNAGALATVDWGTALSVIYKANNAGIPLHVWVDETRPRNQGASLTCWELSQEGIANTLIVDNAGGHLMQSGQVDICIVGSDRTTISGDVCNKIGTYLKALAARDNAIPFYVALPISSIDFTIEDGLRDIPIEERDSKEVSEITGPDCDGIMRIIRVASQGTAISNPGFDVTPAKLITAIITERGVHEATKASLERLLQ